MIPVRTGRGGYLTINDLVNGIPKWKSHPLAPDRLGKSNAEFPIHSIIFLNFPCPIYLSMLGVKLLRTSNMNMSLQKAKRITSTSNDMSTRITCLLEDWERMK